MVLRNQLLPLLTITVIASGSDWQTVKPGGSTACSHNTPFAFFVRYAVGRSLEQTVTLVCSPGDPERVVLELEGGGCCFSKWSCALPQYIRSISVPGTLALLKARGGLANHADQRNPVQNWCAASRLCSVVTTAACTGPTCLCRTALVTCIGSSSHAQEPSIAKRSLRCVHVCG